LVDLNGQVPTHTHVIASTPLSAKPPLGGGGGFWFYLLLLLDTRMLFRIRSLGADIDGKPRSEIQFAHIGLQRDRHFCYDATANGNPCIIQCWYLGLMTTVGGGMVCIWR
jgi:hypothetical protein